MKFPDSDFDSLPHFHDKMSVQIIMETSGPHSEIPTSLAEIVTDKKWRSTWFFINPSKHSWYIIERYYQKVNEKAIQFEEKKANFIGFTFTLRTRKSFGLLRHA